MNSCNGKPPAKILDEVAVPYSKDLNIECLIVQLSMITDLVKTHKQDPRLQLKHVTSIHTLCDILNSSNICFLKYMPYYVSILLCVSLKLQRREPFLFSGV